MSPFFPSGFSVCGVGLVLFCLAFVALVAFTLCGHIEKAYKGKVLLNSLYAGQNTAVHSLSCSNQVFPLPFFFTSINSVEGFLLLPLTGFFSENNYEFCNFQQLHSSSSVIQIQLWNKRTVFQVLGLHFHLD